MKIRNTVLLLLSCGTASLVLAEVTQPIERAIYVLSATNPLLAERLDELRSTLHDRQLTSQEENELVELMKLAAEAVGSEGKPHI